MDRCLVRQHCFSFYLIHIVSPLAEVTATKAVRLMNETFVDFFQERQHFFIVKYEY